MKEKPASRPQKRFLLSIKQAKKSFSFFLLVLTFNDDNIAVVTSRYVHRVTYGDVLARLELWVDICCLSLEG